MMLLTEMTPHDLSQLRQFRTARFMQFFASSLHQSAIQIDSDDVLAVYCPHSAIVDELMDELEDLRSHAWLILGVRKIVFYFCQEEILNTDTDSSSYLQAQATR
jgi:hypothetical protein